MNKLDVIGLTFGFTAVIEEEIGPVARMSAVIVGQSFFASNFFGFTESTTVEEQFAGG